MRSLICVLALGLAACASMPPSGGEPASTRLDPAEQRGRDFAVRRCAGCHTVGLDDGGAQDGPAFRTLARRYNALALQRRFAEVAEHGYDRMPPVSFSQAEAEDLIAYFETLQDD